MSLHCYTLGIFHILSYNVIFHDQSYCSVFSMSLFTFFLSFCYLYTRLIYLIFMSLMTFLWRVATSVERIFNIFRIYFKSESCCWPKRSSHPNLIFINIQTRRQINVNLFLFQLLFRYIPKICKTNEHNLIRIII